MIKYVNRNSCFDNYVSFISFLKDMLNYIETFFKI